MPQQTTIDRALALAARGIPVFPCHNATKRPACKNGFKDASTDPDTIRALFADAPADSLTGFPTGEASGWCVLDLDVKPERDSAPWLAANSHRLPPTLVQTTRSLGTHWYFLHYPGLRNSNDRIAPGVDIRADGGYAIAWGEHGCPLFLDEPVAPFPEWLADLAIRSQPAERSGPVDLSDLAAPSVAAVVQLLDRMPNPDDTNRETWLRVMLGSVGAMDGLGDTGDEIPDAACRWAARWSLSLGFDAEREKWDSDFATRDAPLAGWRTLESIAGRLIPEYRYESACAEFMAHPLPPPPDDSADPKWRHRLTRSDTGKVQATIPNVLAALQYAPDWRGVVGFDEFRGILYLTGRPPWDIGRGVWKPRPLRDTDITHVAAWLQSAGMQVSPTTAYDGIRVLGDRRRFDPVKQYLRSIKWDRVPRIDRFLIDLAGAEDSALTRAMSGKFFISAAARVFEPGCKLDVMPIFSGAQGLLKSTLIRVIFGAEFYIDHMPDLSSKDAAIQMQGVWGLEIAEFDKMHRTETAVLKAWLSTAKDKYREPYGKVAEDHPRRSVPVATVNPDGTGFLRDGTGNRRNWVIPLGVGWLPGRKIDIATVVRDRDQMHAEAVARYDAGESWWLETAEQEAGQEAIAADHMQVDPWDSRVVEYLADKAETSVDDVLGQAIGKPVAQWTRADQMRISAALKSAGWVRRRVSVGTGLRAWRYFNGAASVVRPFVSNTDPTFPVLPRPKQTGIVCWDNPKTSTIPM
jgi:predicted P-loop ATPase